MQEENREGISGALKTLAAVVIVFLLLAALYVGNWRNTWTIHYGCCTHWWHHMEYRVSNYFCIADCAYSSSNI